MAITIVDSRDELSDLVDELGVYSEGEEVDVLEDEDVYLNEGLEKSILKRLVFLLFTSPSPQSSKFPQNSTNFLWISILGLL